MTDQPEKILCDEMISPSPHLVCCPNADFCRIRCEHKKIHLSPEDGSLCWNIHPGCFACEPIGDIVVVYDERELP
jgi:hypothetical protein